MGIGRAELSHISILYPILPPMKRDTLLPRSGKYGICTDLGNRAEISRISIVDPILPPVKRGNLLPRRGEYSISTDKGNTFLDFPCP